MKMIKNDIKRIEEKKKTGLSVHFSYFSQEENKHPKKDNTPIVHGYSNRKWLSNLVIDLMYFAVSSTINLLVIVTFSHFG